MSIPFSDIQKIEVEPAGLNYHLIIDTESGRITLSTQQKELSDFRSSGLLGYEGSSYTLYEDDGVHKEYDKAENYRKLENNRMKRSLESLWKFHDEV